MIRFPRRPLLASSVPAALLALALPAAGQCPNVDANRDPLGAPGNGGAAVGTPFRDRHYLSADGRYSAFWSNASNLVANDTNGVADVFVRDRVTGVTERVSVSSAGIEGDGDSLEPAITADGRLVVFQSNATNLVPGDTNGKSDVFVRDRIAGTTIRVSVDTAGLEANGNSSWPDISSDGRYVAFQSLASNLVAVDTNLKQDVFVRDLIGNVTNLTSADQNGAQGNRASGAPSLSADGRYVAFHSDASNLVPGDTNAEYDVFVRDRLTLHVERISVNDSGEEGDYFAQTPSISADGRFVAFSSIATNMVANDTNNVFDVFVRDRALSKTERISVDSQGYQGNSTSQGTSISADGRFVVFSSSANNLVTGDGNGGPFNLNFDVFVRDRLLRTTTRLSVDDNGVEGDVGSSVAACISADASTIAYATDATNLVAGDTNGLRDWIVRACPAAPLPEGLCFGDGSGSACPCGNTGAVGRGCANTVDPGGARLEAYGTTSLGHDTLFIQAYGLPAVASCLLFQGTSLVAGGNGGAFGDGLRCAGGSITRIGIRFASGGYVTYGANFTGDPPLHVSGQIQSGTVSLRFYQLWYRNTATFCQPEGFNLTNAARVTWTP